MSDAEKIAVLRAALENVRKLTMQDQDWEPDPAKVAERKWAEIQATAARALRDTD